MIPLSIDGETIVDLKQRWWVSFRDKLPGDATRWWDWFTRPGYRHCSAFTELPTGVMLFLDPHCEMMVMASFVSWPWVWVEQELELGHDVFVVDIELDPYSPVSGTPALKRGPLISCSAVLAYQLGLVGIAATPWGLRKLIEKHGGHQLDRETVR